MTDKTTDPSPSSPSQAQLAPVTMGELNELLEDSVYKVRKIDGMDKALIGMGTVAGRPQLVYSLPLLIGVLMERDGMSHEDAYEFAAFNILDAFVGKGTPLIMIYSLDHSPPMFEGINGSDLQGSC